MRRPIPIASLLNKSLKDSGNDQEKPVGLPSEADPDYEKKLRLAALLHDQGVNPVAWQQAEMAPYEAQRRYHETRQVPEEMFVVGGRLYRRRSAIAATRAQGQDALDVFLGAAPKPVSDLVPVAKVQLRHPFGNRPDKLPEGTAALERYRHFAKLGIDPDHAHEGDAIPHHLQDGLKRAVTSADGKEIPLGIPGVYRNPDDGFFYMAHSGTEERDEVTAMRRRLATEKAERTGGTDPIAGNDNDPDINEAVAQFYRQEREGWREPGDDDSVNEPQAKAAKKSNQRIDENRAPTQFDYSSPEAAVGSLFGMDPDVARPNILPDPRGSDGEFTSDVSQWTAPALLYDMARAFVTPTVAADGGQVTEADVQNMALSITGGGAGAVRAAPHGGVGMPWAAADKVPRHLARTVDEVVEIYSNTRPVELKEQLALSPTKTLRAIRLKNGKIFTWPAEKALHTDAIEILLKEGKIVETDLKGAERLLYQDGVGYYAE